MVADQGTDFSMVTEPSRCGSQRRSSSAVRGWRVKGGVMRRRGIGAAGWRRRETTFNFYPFSIEGSDSENPTY